MSEAASTGSPRGAGFVRPCTSCRAPSDCTDHFDAVVVLKYHVNVPATRHDFVVHFHRHTLPDKPERLQQLRHGERGFQMPFLAVQGDAHGHGRGRQKSKMDYNERLIVLPVVTPCTGSNAPAWSARVWFNGRTRASQALDVGSIPITRSIPSALATTFVAFLHVMLLP